MGNLRWQRGSHRQGKEMMSAVYGFVLALTSFLILKTVNPALVDFTDIKIAEVPIIGQDLPGAETLCGRMSVNGTKGAICRGTVADLGEDTVWVNG